MPHLAGPTVQVLKVRKFSSNCQQHLQLRDVNSDILPLTICSVGSCLRQGTTQQPGYLCLPGSSH